MKKDKKENLWVSQAFMNCQSQKFAVLSCEENFQVIHTSQLDEFSIFKLIKSNQNLQENQASHLWFK